MNIFCPLRTILGTENPDRNVKAKRFEIENNDTIVIDNYALYSFWFECL